jgi:hypothetical protein
MKDLTINVSKQFDGFTFSLTPLARRDIQNEFPTAKPIKGIFVSFDFNIKSDLNQFFDRIEKYIYPALTGIDDKEDLSKIENLRFVDSSTNEELYKFSSAHVEE